MQHLRTALLALLLIAFANFLRAAEPALPLVEKYLSSGQLSQGEVALEAALARTPRDDQLRFGLGVLRFVRAVERLGQMLYEGGVKSEHANAPFLRLPVPINSDPAIVRYATF